MACTDPALDARSVRLSVTLSQSPYLGRPDRPSLSYFPKLFPHSHCRTQTEPRGIDCKYCLSLYTVHGFCRYILSVTLYDMTMCEVLKLCPFLNAHSGQRHSAE